MRKEGATSNDGTLEDEEEAEHFHSGTIPALIIASVNAYNLWNEHWAHWAHLEPLEERTEYEYQNLRTKNFFWGDGDKVSSFQIRLMKYNC